MHGQLALRRDLRWRRWPWCACLFLALHLSTGPALLAQEDEVAEDAEQTGGPKITLHGYLTQAYAQSDGHQFLGITEDGTADYRTAALQIRADITPDDTFVLQLDHERIGESQVQTLKDDVGVDWLFYEHRFGSSAVKVGRIQIPFGIYNEVRDVGTLLPFYRPPHNFYGEAAYSSETIDGIVLSHRRAFGNWGLDVDLHFGDWKFIERTIDNSYVTDEVDDSLGLELWLDTPISGLRIGAGGMQYQISQPTGEAEWKAYHVSVAGEFDRFAVHAENKWVDLGKGFLVDIRYLHLGVNVTDKIVLNGQLEEFYVDIDGFPRAKGDEDLAFGVNYAFRPDLVLKAEHHSNEGRLWLEDLTPFGPNVDTKYWILSLSTSF
jgi:hypothetical protein